MARSTFHPVLRPVLTLRGSFRVELQGALEVNRGAAPSAGIVAGIAAVV